MEQVVGRGAGWKPTSAEHLPNTRHSYMHDGIGLIEARTSQVRRHTSLKRKPVLRRHMLARWLPGQLKRWQPILLQMESTLVFNLREKPYWTRGQRHRNITWGVRCEHGSGNSGVAWGRTRHLGPRQALREEQTILKQTTIDEPILKARQLIWGMHTFSLNQKGRKKASPSLAVDLRTRDTHGFYAKSSSYQMFLGKICKVLSQNSGKSQQQSTLSKFNIHVLPLQYNQLEN